MNKELSEITSYRETTFVFLFLEMLAIPEFARIMGFVPVITVNCISLRNIFSSNRLAFNEKSVTAL